MPKGFFPYFSEGMIHINSSLAYQKENGRVYYFNGHHMPVFSHDEEDVQSFKMIMSQFCVNGNAKQAEVNRTFGIPPITMKRAVKTFREQGPSGFFKVKKKKNQEYLLLTCLAKYKIFSTQEIRQIL